MNNTQIDPAAVKATFGPSGTSFPNLKFGWRFTATSAIMQGDNGTAWLTITSGGLVPAGTLTPGGLITAPASATASAGFRLTAGVDPTSPVNGDIWQDGTDLKIRIGGVTKTVTLV